MSSDSLHAGVLSGQKRPDTQDETTTLMCNHSASWTPPMTRSSLCSFTTPTVPVAVAGGARARVYRGPARIGARV